MDISPNMVPVGEYKESHEDRVRPGCDEQYNTRKFECEREMESCFDDVVLLQRSLFFTEMLDHMLNRDEKSSNVMSTIEDALERRCLLRNKVRVFSIKPRKLKLPCQDLDDSEIKKRR